MRKFAEFFDVARFNSRVLKVVFVRLASHIRFVICPNDIVAATCESQIGSATSAEKRDRASPFGLIHLDDCTPHVNCRAVNRRACLLELPLQRGHYALTASARKALSVEVAGGGCGEGGGGGDDEDGSRGLPHTGYYNRRGTQSEPRLSRISNRQSYEKLDVELSGVK